MSASPVFVAVVGAGVVGRAFVNQLRDFIAANPARAIIPILIARSNKSLKSNDYTGVDLSTWESALDNATKAPPSIPDGLHAFLKAAPGPTILVDNTSNETIANAYPSFLASGIHIVTPNKKAFSSTLDLWNQIKESSRPVNPTGGFIFHEATVGAGLPVLSTLRDLLATGDKIHQINGVFSGTMSFLFNSFHPAAPMPAPPFSEIVAQARSAGYTEPDPRDDLNGLDVARKLTILARLAGLPVALPTSFPIESLVPADLESAATAEEFLSGLPAHDAAITARKAEADKAGKVLRYVGSLDVQNGKVEVGVKAFEKDSAIAGLKGSDNIISFKTERYPNPLIVQGAGAGAEVTAMGVLADLIRVLARV